MTNDDITYQINVLDTAIADANECLFGGFGDMAYVKEQVDRIAIWRYQLCTLIELRDARATRSVKLLSSRTIERVQFTIEYGDDHDETDGNLLLSYKRGDSGWVVQRFSPAELQELSLAIIDAQRKMIGKKL